MGWQVNRARDQVRSVATIERYHGGAFYDFEFANGEHTPGKEPPAPRWLRRALGDAYFQKVAGVIYYSQPITDATLEPLDKLETVEYLAFTVMTHTSAVKPPKGWDRLTECGIARLESLRHLRSFELAFPSKYEIELRSWKHADRLEELCIQSAGAFDAELPELGSMPRLRVLVLSGNQLTGSFLRSMPGSKTLETLDLSANPISSDGFRTIGLLSTLRDLNLSNTKLDDSRLAYLSKLRLLKRLRLHSTRVTTAGLVHLAAMKQLEELDIGECRISGPSLSALREMPRLRSLDLDGAKIDDTALVVLKGMTLLEHLNLSTTTVTDAGMRHLRGLKKLKHLALFPTSVTPGGLSRLRRALPSLSGVAYWFQP
jgi:hypothetical protein